MSEQTTQRVPSPPPPLHSQTPPGENSSNAVGSPPQPSSSQLQPSDNNDNKNSANNSSATHPSNNHNTSSAPTAAEKKHIASLNQPKHEVCENNSARGRAKLISMRMAVDSQKTAYIPIKYEEDRIRQEQADIANVLELQQQQQQQQGGGAAATHSKSSSSNLHGSTNNATNQYQQQQMLLVGRRGTIGNATINPTALRIHPRGFKMLSAGSPMERNMKNYFRLPAQPPQRVLEEHNKLRSAIKQQIIAAEKKQQRLLQQTDAQKSLFGGVSTAHTVSTTVTTTIKRPNGTVETVEEVLYGKQLDGFLLLENSVGLPGVSGYDANNNPLYGDNNNSSNGASGGGNTNGRSSASAPMSVTERYYRDRERQRRKEERANRQYQRDLQKQAKLEAKLAKMRRREEVLEMMRNGQVPPSKHQQQQNGTADDASNTFITGTKIVNPDKDDDDEDELDDDLDDDDEDVDEEEEEEPEDDDDDGYDELDLNRPAVDDSEVKVPTDPSLAVEANINDRNLIGVVAEDLSFFSRMVFVDAGENRLLVSDFANLPSIEELHMHCNALTQLSDLADAAAEAEVNRQANSNKNNDNTAASDANLEGGGGSGDNSAAIPPFSFLHSLNLSFNRIPPHELAFLVHMPSLTRLDLSNNNLKTISIEFAQSACPHVTHLALEGNKFKNALHIFACLAVMPRLVEVNLNDNNFEAIPSTTEMISYLPAKPRYNNNNNEEDDDQNHEEEEYAIFPALEALGIANNKLQFVEDVFPVIQFPQLARIVLWGNPLAAQSRDADIVVQELSNAGISEIILDNPTLPKRHPQDFYSTRPLARAAEQKKISNTFGAAKRPLRGGGGTSKTTATTQRNGGGGVIPTQSQQALLAEETREHLQHIFDVTTGVGGGASSSHTISLNGPSGAFIRLPDEVHSDYSHIRGLKGQGLTQHNLPTVLPSQKKKQRGKGGASDNGTMDPLSAADVPQTASSRLRASNNGNGNAMATTAKPKGGTAASLNAPTASSKKRKEATKEENDYLKQRIADEERWLPPIDGGGGGLSGRGGVTLSSTRMSPNGNATDSLPYYLGGGGGGMTDGSTTQQALNELRRMLAKK